MNIILAAGIFPPDIGGPATYTTQLAESLNQQGHSVRVICFSDTTENRREKYHVTRIKRSRLKPWSHLIYLLKLYFISSQADCIYTQGPTAAGWQARLVAKFRHIPYVVKVVGDYAWEQGRVRFGLDCSIEDFQQLATVPPVVERLRKLQKAVVSEAQRVVVPSKYLAELVQLWGVSPERISVIYNSFTPQFQSEKISQKKNIFLTGGRLLPWKGFDTLIKLWPQVIAQAPNAQLEIAGDGPDGERLKKLILETGVSSSVTMLGRLKPEELVSHYLQAKSFILNSDYEGMSHMILEAMSAGAVPLVSRRGGNQELVQDGVTGWSFSYNDSAEILTAILKLAQFETADSQMAQAIQLRSREFSPELMINSTIKMLTDVIKSQPRV